MIWLLRTVSLYHLFNLSVPMSPLRVLGEKNLIVGYPMIYIYRVSQKKVPNEKGSF